MAVKTDDDPDFSERSIKNMKAILRGSIVVLFIEPKLNKEVYYTSMEEKQSWGRPSAARMSF